MHVYINVPGSRRATILRAEDVSLSRKKAFNWSDCIFITYLDIGIHYPTEDCPVRIARVRFEDPATCFVFTSGINIENKTHTVVGLVQLTSSVLNWLLIQSYCATSSLMCKDLTAESIFENASISPGNVVSICLQRIQVSIVKSNNSDMIASYSYIAKKYTVVERDFY